MIDFDLVRWKAMLRSIDAYEATFQMRERIDQIDKLTSLQDCLWAEFLAMDWWLNDHRASRR
jgi:hypothetical protein